MILAHDYCRGTNGTGKRYETFIGKNCVIGVNSIVLPGLKIAAGAVVTKDIPSHSMVAGNPAKILRKGVVVSDLGQILNNGEKVGDV